MLMSHPLLDASSMTASPIPGRNFSGSATRS